MTGTKQSSRHSIRTRAPGLYLAGSRLLRPVADLAARAVQAIESARYRNQDHAAATGTSAVSPRVVLDGCAFQDPNGGIARVWRNVMAEWSASGFAEHVVVLDRHGTAPRFDGFAYRPLPRVRAYDSASQRRLLERVCRWEGADVFVSTMYTHPTHVPSLLYVYDMTPEVLGWNLRDPLWREKRRAILHATSLVCLSESTARDLRRVYPDAATVPCSVVLPGVERSFVPAPPGDISAFRKAWGLPESYFIFMGYRDGYKNAQLLFEALADMDDRSFGVLLIGGAPVLEPHLTRQVRGPLTHAPSLSDADLRAAYSGASALLYLSRYEGFGLPILEAISCGCPVITCRNSSLPEAAGPAALYVDQDSPADLRAAMERVVQSDVRRDLLARGGEWVRLFSWTRTASGLEDAIPTVAGWGSDG